METIKIKAKLKKDEYLVDDDVFSLVTAIRELTSTIESLKERIK